MTFMIALEGLSPTKNPPNMQLEQPARTEAVTENEWVDGWNGKSANGDVTLGCPEIFGRHA